MALSDIPRWLMQNEGFQERLIAVTVDMACSELGDTFTRSADLRRVEHDWRYLLFAASALSVSSGGDCQAAALRIAQSCLCSANTTAQLRESAALILDCLANQPAIALAVRREMLNPDFRERLPTAAHLESIRRSLENSVHVDDGSVLAMNRFQRRFWAVASEHGLVSFSAPTSAGKSFILARWIREYIRQFPRATIVYLVPTRALISQVEADLKCLFAEDSEPRTSISSLPLQRVLSASDANVLVFTQERLHLLMAAAPELRVDLLIVDEAHKIGDRQRGVLLQAVVEQVTAANSRARVIFSSPMASNPEVLLADTASAPDRTSFTSEDVTVNQNLIWVSQRPRQPRRWSVALCLPDRQVHLGDISLQALPAPESKRLPFVAFAVGGHRPGNIIYVNGAAEAEKIATQLYDLSSAENGTVSDVRIDQLVDLAQRVVHKEFLLAKVLRRGIAFHYGNLPLLIKSEVEKLFSLGVIRYLVCTSTLMEGVNMACRNIFLRGPQKGRGTPISAEDFWNLAGRAGRWGKEFQGNVVCVDAAKANLWGPDGPPRARIRYAIRRTADKVLSDPGALITFIHEGAPRDVALKRPELEYMFSYLVAVQARHGSILSSPWATRYSGGVLVAIDEAITDSVRGLQTPHWVIERNPGISPLAMDALLKYFREREGAVEELLPVHPASDDAPLVYAKIFGRLASRMLPRLGPPPGRSFMLGLLVTRWMRGHPLARLIADRIRLNRERGVHVSTAAAIRNVMEDVEQIARFEAPKGLACYMDLLRIHLEEIGRSDLVAEIPDVGLLLELGVSQQTQVALIGLGLSRTSAIGLSELIAADDLTEEQIIEWLSSNSRLWREADLPALVKQEIETVCGNNIRRAG